MPNADQLDDLDFTTHFDTKNSPPEPKLSDVQLKHIDDLGVIGAQSLKSAGYYARIVSSQPRRATARLPSETTVLVVEDDEGTAGVILKVLGTSGYQTRHARNLREIVAELGRKPMPDAILLDVMLPNVNGFEVLNKIRWHPRLKNIPVLMLTSLSERADIVKGLCYGADGYLTKPTLPSTLLDAVQAVLSG